MPGVSVNQAGVVKTVTAIRVNVAGVVKAVLEGYVNQAGAVKKFWPSVGVPGAPGNYRVTGSTASSLSVAWDASVANGSPVTGYRVEYGTDGVNFPTGQSYGAGTTSGTISGLSASTLYYTRIKATSALGDSPYSFAQGTTSIATAPQAPSITVTSVSSGSCEIRITAGGGGTPTFYEVDRALNTNCGSGPFTWTTIAPNLAYTGSPQSYSSTGLESAQCYAYRVRARNGAGTSSNSGNAYGNTLGNVAFGSIGCAEDPDDIGAFKDTGFGLNSTSIGASGVPFGTNYVGSVGGITLERFARTGNTNMAIWLLATTVPSDLFTRISIGSGQYAYSANVGPQPPPGGGPSGNLFTTTWGVPSLAAGDWLPGANISVNIGK
jgi:hypothetical protein